MNESSFEQIFEQHEWAKIKARIYSCTPDDAEKALIRPGRCSLQDFAALVSPAAAPFLEEMAQLSRALTLRRFGSTIRLYIPLYVSNECQNICTYCGFSVTNRIDRLTLSPEQLAAEVKVIKAHGYDHVLVVSGESHKVGVDYFAEVLKILRDSFSEISLEVQPLEQDEYKRLIESGLRAVLVYQETYNRISYSRFHPRGKKAKFPYRLATPERLGRAGIHKIGLGALLGLDDWRTDSWFTALHLSYLRKKFWQTRYSVSFPRLRPAKGVQPDSVMSEREIAQLICAWRIFDENVDLSLSTRESAAFRNNALKLGITSMSAGSRTEPGGYALKAGALEQFEINDERPPGEVAKMIRQAGYDPVWKDWDRIL